MMFESFYSVLDSQLQGTPLSAPSLYRLQWGLPLLEQHWRALGSLCQGPLSHAVQAGQAHETEEFKQAGCWCVCKVIRGKFWDKILHPWNYRFHWHCWHFQEPYVELFLWAILTNKTAIIDFCWQRCQQPIVCAIIAASIYSKLGMFYQGHLKKTHLLHDKKALFQERANKVAFSCKNVLWTWMLQEQAEILI